MNTAITEVTVCDDCGSAIETDDWSAHHGWCDCYGDGSDCEALASTYALVETLAVDMPREPDPEPSGYRDCYVCGQIYVADRASGSIYFCRP